MEGRPEAEEAMSFDNNQTGETKGQLEEPGQNPKMVCWEGLTGVTVGTNTWFVKLGCTLAVANRVIGAGRATWRSLAR